MAEVITFRPTAEVAEILARVKDEGGNVSKYINERLTENQGEQSDCTPLYSYYTLTQLSSHEAAAKKELVNRNSVPIGTLPARRYREFLDVLRAVGMEYHYFVIDDDHRLGLVAPNRDEACIEFAKYYTLDSRTGRYDRTALPLPQVRYDTASQTAIVITIEKDHFK